MNRDRAERQNHPSDEEKTWIHEIFADHSIQDLSKSYSWNRLAGIVRGESFRAVVMSADIRESTTLLDKATSLNHFVAVVGEMINAASQLVRHEDGFFDKFLGDGFLAYWIPSDYGRQMFEEERDRATRHLVDAITLGIGMNDVFASGLGELSQHIEGMKPTGFAVGIEVGEAGFFKIAGQWTIMGMPVVRASRLASAKENVGKTYIGRGARELLNEAPDGNRLPNSLRIEHGSVSTKDPGNQLEAYQVLQTG